MIDRTLSAEISAERNAACYPTLNSQNIPDTVKCSEMEWLRENTTYPIIRCPIYAPSGIGAHALRGSDKLIAPLGPTEPITNYLPNFLSLDRKDSTLYIIEYEKGNGFRSGLVASQYLHR
jgi:hypothetical protein